jgi:hypothetical protein
MPIGEMCDYCHGSGELFGEVGVGTATSFEMDRCPYCDSGFAHLRAPQTEKRIDWDVIVRQVNLYTLKRASLYRSIARKAAIRRLARNPYCVRFKPSTHQNNRAPLL